MKIPPELIAFLKEQDNFFIATHINPEADALGSAIALSMALDSLGKSTLVYDRDTVPEFYRFLPGNARFIHTTSDIQTSACNLVLLDCNTPERAGIDGIPFKYSAVIDHHETEADFGDLKWVAPDVAATGIMIFHLLKEMGIPFSRDIAVNLYSAIAIDTGTFRYDNTTAGVLRVAAELIDAGADPSLVARSLYETWSERRFRLLISALNTLEIRDGIAFTCVTQDMFRATGTNAEDTENFPGFPRMMKDVRISAFFREIGENYWKVSLRSRGKVNVAAVALHFGGGGHKNAAGFRIKADLESTKRSLLDQAENLA